MEYKWPLSVPQFSLLDKLKYAKFILTDDRWTHGKYVEHFEKEMANYVGTSHALFTSSGSTANTLLAMYLKDRKKLPNNKVAFPSTTWITSVAPFIREGIQPVFFDVNMSDLSIDLDKLEEYLYDNELDVLFITSLIGFTPDIARLQYLEKHYNVKIMMDNCENTLGRYKNHNVSHYFTSTTSTYFGHQIQSVEGGFIFTHDLDLYEYCLMARNHGMIRHLPRLTRPIYMNDKVDSRFDFNVLGNNFRNTNLHAFLGLCDLKRADEYLDHRRFLYDIWRIEMRNYFILPKDTDYQTHAPFCLPIILKRKYRPYIHSIKTFLNKHGIETRPIISGNLLRQSCLERLNLPHPVFFNNSEELHKYGIYVGIHKKLRTSDVIWLCDSLKGVLDAEI